METWKHRQRSNCMESFLKKNLHQLSSCSVTELRRDALAANWVVWNWFDSTRMGFNNRKSARNLFICVLRFSSSKPVMRSDGGISTDCNSFYRYASVIDSRMKIDFWKSLEALHRFFLFSHERFKQCQWLLKNTRLSLSSGTLTKFYPIDLAVALLELRENFARNSE